MSKSIRIRTTPGNSDKYLKIKLEQDFDFIEILSLKILQEDVYRKFCADYGVIAGRVIANNGFGVENVKISVFVPISDTDKENPLIYGVYPFENISDVDENGVRYNLLTKEQQYECFSPVGTMPSKREILDNDVLLEVYEKYYKYTTTTNKAGDYLLFGIPVGQHIIHMDADISDIGVLSQRPYDMIRLGSNKNQFESPTKFKTSKNINTLVQIKSANLGINVQPFWGDKDFCEIGICRADFNLNYHFEPTAIFMGSFFSDNEKYSVSKTCRPRRKLGELCSTTTSEGTIEMIRKTIDGTVERFDVEGGKVIDANGAWAYQIPMNLDYVTTDEYGNLVPSEDPSKGIPTSAKVRFRISMDQTGGEGRLRTRAKYLVPNNTIPSSATTLEDAYVFDETIKDEFLYTFKWNKLYTIKNLIMRYQPNSSVDNRNFIGIKTVDNCGSHNPFPYNRVDTDLNPLFSIICLIVTLISALVYVFNLLFVSSMNFIIGLLNEFLKLVFGFLNTIVGFINGIIGFLGSVSKLLGGNGLGSIPEFKGDYFLPFVPCLTLSCDGEKYAPGCENNGGLDKAKENNGVISIETSESKFMDCIQSEIGDALNVFDFEFYNDWVNGTLYLPLLKYKKKRHDKVEKFCEYDCGPKFDSNERKNDCGNSKFLLDSGKASSLEPKEEHHVSLYDGIVKKYGGELYYAAISHNEHFPLYPTDIFELGSVLPCDYDGYPYIHKELIPTTYQRPDYTTKSDGGVLDEAAISDYGKIPGLFFNANCFSFTVGGTNIENIKISCELGVDFTLEHNMGSNSGNTALNNINNPYVRQALIWLNSKDSNIKNITPGSIDDSFRHNEKTAPESGVFYSNLVTPNDYYKYRGLISMGNGGMKINRDNSLFFYFGIVPGKSALEKANGKYFTNCLIPVVPDILLDANINNVTTINGSDGVITITVIGGDINDYIFSWSNGGNTNIISGLKSGLYTVTVTEKSGNGYSVTSTYKVSEPLHLKAYVSSTDLTSANSNDGTIMIDYITGGVSPYSLELSAKTGTITSYSNITNGYTVNNLKNDNYDVIISDSSSPKETDINSVIINAPQPLNLSLVTTNVSCFGAKNGIIKSTVTGGVKPYTFELTYPDNTTKNSGYVTGLDLGNYSVKVTDAKGTINTKTTTILGASKKLTSSMVVTPIKCNNGTGSVKISIDGGVSPYEVSKDGITWDLVSGVEYTYNNLSSGNYIIKTRDSYHCIANDLYFGLDNPDVLVNTSSVSGKDITFVSSGGRLNHVFTINGVSGNFYAGGKYTGAASTTYTVNVTDENGTGCVASINLTTGS